MEITMRLETPGDYRAVEELTREAFWGFSRPTCDEHYLVHLLRGVPAFVPELDFIAEADGKLAGNVMYSKSRVIGGGGETEVLTFGPLSVLPEYQRRGVGAALMRRSIVEAKRLGYRAIIIYGHPDYYPRFGFRNAEDFGITNPEGKSFDALMALPLHKGALDGVSGEFHEDPVFHMNKADAEAYNQGFPYKKPAEMLPIELLLNRLEPAAREAFTSREINTLTWLNRLSGREMLKWDGIGEKAMEVVNQTLKEHGYAEKLYPDSYILQLARMGLLTPAVNLISEKAGISVYRVESEGKSYVLKAFAREEDRREIENYRLLASLGIPMLPPLDSTESAILLPDLESDATYRLGKESDLSDVDIARATARWYRTLHEKGRVYVAEKPPAMYDESDFITHENMSFIAEKTGTKDNSVWKIVSERIDDIRLLAGALPRTLTYNDFYWTNLVVERDEGSAMMLDFNLMGKGYAYADVRNVTYSLEGEAKEAFINEYGAENISEAEARADAVLEPLITLYSACRHKTMPKWSEGALNEITSGALERSLIEWLKNNP